jgi:hypothetical protein
MPSDPQTDPDQPLVRLLYTSRATPECLADLQGGIDALLATAQRHNPEHQITGALVAHKGWFIQVLEGPEDEVHGLFRKICLDERHCSANLVSEGPVETRDFAHWSMCARQLSSLDARILAELDRNAAFDPADLPESQIMELLHAVAAASARTS